MCLETPAQGCPKSHFGDSFPCLNLLQGQDKFPQMLEALVYPMYAKGEVRLIYTQSSNEENIVGPKPAKRPFASNWKEGDSEEAEETVWDLVVNFIFWKGKRGWVSFPCNAILNDYKSASFYSSNLLMPQKLNVYYGFTAMECVYSVEH